MKQIIKENRIWLILIIAAALIAAGYSLYRSRSTELLDKEAFKEFRSAVSEVGESEAGGFQSQDELRSFIESWADENSLEYTEDESGNIIFDREAAGRKKNTTPTLVAVSMNYETAADKAGLLAAAASIALSDVESSRRTVIFFDDEQSLGKGYKGIDKSYLSGKPKIIYMDEGSSTYLSTSSFREVFSEVSVPAEREESTLDSAVRISISGIDSGEIGTSISRQPDPISAVSSLLTRLKSKSVDYRIADISVGSNGNMYPVSAEITVTMNSYAVGSFTSYIEKRIKAWEKSYGKDYEDLSYSYEVISDDESMPETVYTRDTCDSLTSVLYTVKTGIYRYSEGDPAPEGRDAGDTYGISCAVDLAASDEDIKLKLITQGYNEMFTERILTDNKTAAELYGCGYDQTGTIKEFTNEKDSLSQTFMTTYRKVNEDSSANQELTLNSDNYFTPCSLIAKRNKKADIIHLRFNGSNAAVIANTVLCYIKAKGNTSIFR